MNNLWINIRFGKRHLKVGWGRFSFGVNSYYIDYPADNYIEVFTFFFYEQ